MKDQREICPCNVVMSRFMGSPFGVAEMEMMLQCIVVTQYKMNPDAWTSFTWGEYVAKCDHQPIDTEKKILEAMVSGGDVWIGRQWRYISAGYLRKDGEKYVIAEKLLDIMRPYAK